MHEIEQFKAKGFVPDGRGGFYKPAREKRKALVGGVSAAEPEPHRAAALERVLPAEGAGEPCAVPRTIVRIERRAVRLLDADNFAGGCKPLIDALRGQGLIADDDPETVNLQFRQRRVASKKEEGTEIVIEVAM
jgi:hypothetical protein